jgi:spermidine/putrescine-binding protein
MMSKKLVDGVLTDMTEQEIAQRDSDNAAYAADLAANGYKSDRAAAYPSIEDQLDDIYHNGIDAWKANILAVKQAHPKPEAV